MWSKLPQPGIKNTIAETDKIPGGITHNGPQLHRINRRLNRVLRVSHLSLNKDLCHFSLQLFIGQRDPHHTVVMVNSVRIRMNCQVAIIVGQKYFTLAGPIWLSAGDTPLRSVQEFNHRAVATFSFFFQSRELLCPVLQKLITFGIEARLLYACQRQLSSNSRRLTFGKIAATVDADVTPTFVDDVQLIEFSQLLFIEHYRRYGILSRIHFLPGFCECPRIITRKDNRLFMLVSREFLR
jgi:hypothetical protein